MKGKTLVALARIFAGTSLLIASMVTGVNGTVQSTALLLLGLPVEGLIKNAASANKED